MTIKDFQEQLKLAKNKDAELVFRIGDKPVSIELMAEVVSDDKGIHFPTLGEVTNAVAVKLIAVAE
jgi:hypothetical protein